MGNNSFKPEKSAKVTGGPASTFSRAINEIQAGGEISDSATADAWAKIVNQRDWESPDYKSDDPNATS